VQNRGLLSSLKLVICSGESLPNSLAQKFYQYFPSEEHLLLNLYGSTEVMGDVLYHPVTGTDTLSPSEKVPIGMLPTTDQNFSPVL